MSDVSGRAQPTEKTQRGTLFLVVGPSGVGKDSLITYCRARLAGRLSVVFPRRAITRATADDAEDHETVSRAEFVEAAAARRFAFSWTAHGLDYGIPATIADDLAAGRCVVVNVSRAIIEEARRRFPPVAIVSVEAPQDLLAERLAKRSREPGETIARRLARADAYRVDGPNVVRLDNSGVLAAAGDAFVRIVEARAAIDPVSAP